MLQGLGLRTSYVHKARPTREMAHVIDAQNMYCRAYQPGVSHTVSRFLSMFNPVLEARYVVAVFDDADITFRHKIWPAYKSNRNSSHDEGTLKIVRSLLKARGVRVIGSKEYEADDLVASVSTVFSKAGIQVRVHSEDKDFFQLLDIATLVRKHRVYTENMLIKSMGLNAEQFIDYQILAGDTVDCIPGARMWGTKSASKYVRAYGSLSGIVKHRDDLPTKLRNGLDKSRDTLKTMARLVTLERDLFDGYGPQDFAMREPDIQRITALAERHHLTLKGFL